MDNAVRLHSDAISLYREQRYPSAYLLSTLSQEEIGKAHMASDFVWHSRVDGRYTTEQEQQFLELLYKHPMKQGVFLRHSNNRMLLLSTEKGRKIFRDVFSGAVEAQKQRAAYVGMRKIRGKIDIKGRILRPYDIKRKQAHTQISLTHDYLVDTCVGIIAEQYEYDISDIRRVFNRRLYKQLRASWLIQSPQTKKWIKQIESFLKKEGMKPLQD